MESMLFDYETTGRTDFRHGQIIPYPKTEYKEKPNCVFIRPPPLKGIQTLTPWNERLRFDTFLKPKDIIGTNPREVQKPYKKPVDVEREQIQKTRPRLVMTPAVSMDDIEDPRMRQILVKDMYTSDMTQKLREVVAPYLSVRAPFPGMPAPANPIYLPPLRELTVSPEWRKDSVKWDAAQLRAHCDPTKQFWLNKELSKSKLLNESMLFDYGTVSRTDFRDGEIKAGVRTQYEPKPPAVRAQAIPPKYIHTLSDWKRNRPVPFDAFFKKPMHKDPAVIQERYDDPPDTDRLQVMKTRPRLIITPIGDIDGIEDQEERDRLIQDMYLTTSEIARRESASAFPKDHCRAPLGDRPAPAIPIKPPKLEFEYVCPEWRMDSVSWDQAQSRATVDPTKEFWLRYPLFKCSACDATSAVTAHRKLRGDVWKKV